MICEFQSLILNTAPRHLAKAIAPSTEIELFNQPTLVVWNGESENTIWGDSTVNVAFRALHDALHLKTRIGFTPIEEMELGRIQAAQYESYSSLLADLVYIEVAAQAKYFLKNGVFVADQIAFTKLELQKLGWKI